MTQLLRISDGHWPRSRADLEQANPLTTFPPDLADAQPLNEFGFILPEPTPPPHHDPLTHRAVEVRPIEGQDGVLRQAWALEVLPPPAQDPDWAELRRALREENGFMDALLVVGAVDPTAAQSLVSRLDEFQLRGNYGLFLESLTLALGALPPQEAAHQALELMALAQRCHLPVDFLAAMAALQS